MKVNAKGILQKLEKERSDREKITLYLSRSLYEEFKSTCGDVAASQVIEELMRQVLESANKKSSAEKK